MTLDKVQPSSLNDLTASGLYGMRISFYQLVIFMLVKSFGI